MGNASVKRTSLVIFILSALVTIPAYFTGKSAAENVSNYADLNVDLIRIHMEAAKEFVLFVSILGLLALVALVSDIKQTHAARIFYVATLAAAIFIFLLTQNMASSGRDISHPELREPVDGLE